MHGHDIEAGGGDRSGGRSRPQGRNRDVPPPEALDREGEIGDSRAEKQESEVEKGQASHMREGGIREVLETSARGAPTAGEAVSDLFATDEIFHRILATADSEFSRSNRLLFLSGLMAGLSVGLSFLARVTFAGVLGEGGPKGFLENAFYPIGFVFVIIGRQQLFTENTFTPVTLVLMRLSSLPRLLKLWAIVYVANILGAAIMALVFAGTDVLSPDAVAAANRFGSEALDLGWTSLLVRGMLAGFMVAGMVWLLHSVRESMVRLILVYLIFFLIPSTGLFHCIIGACEIAYFVLQGGTTVADAVLRFEIPVTLGNTLGGVLFVALPNFFQTGRERFLNWERLSWHDWITGRKELAGHEETDEKPEETASAGTPADEEDETGAAAISR